MVNEIERISLVRKAVCDWKENKLSSFAAMAAVDLITNTEPPSEKMIEWVRSVAKTLDLENLARNYLADEKRME